ncbi:hypothetical protein SH449x_004340 [Pirellulaceae bacterium SH449]
MKILEQVTVPTELKDFFCQVVAAIEKKSKCTNIHSDDLIQCDFAYGGMYEEDGEQFFGCTYFAMPRAQNAKYPRRWYFYLPRQKLEMIASGKLLTIDMWRCDPDCGDKFSRGNDICSYCDY